MNNGIYIEKIDVTSFGKLKNLTLMPSEGINIITAPNESGKSTLGAFIKFIFYGFGGQRKQNLLENEKSLYMPWDGSRVSGGITLVTTDGKFRIERSQSASRESLDIFDAYTRKSVFTGMVPGEVFFGLSEESFGKILFFRQLYSHKNGDDGLAEQIQNLIFSADEKTNTERAMKKLRDLRSSLRNSQKRGRIPDLEAELASYEEKLTRSLEVKRELDTVLVSLGEKKRRIAFNEAKLKALGEESDNLIKWEAKKRLVSLNQLALRKKEADGRYNECMQSFTGEDAPDTAFVKQLIDDSAEYTLLEKSLSGTDSAINEAREQIDSLRKSTPFFDTDPQSVTKRMKRKRIFAVLLFVLAIALGAGGAVMLSSGMVGYCLLGGCGAMLIASMITAAKAPADVKRLGFKNKQEMLKAIEVFPLVKLKIKESERQSQALEKNWSENSERYNSLKNSINLRIKKYMANEEGGSYNLVLQKMMNLSIEAGTLKAESISLSEQLKSVMNDIDLDELKALAESAIEPNREGSAVKREIDFYKSANEALKKQEMELEKQKSYLEASSPSPSVLHGKREAVRKKLAELNMKFDALTVAIETLVQASDRMKATVSPKLAEIASQKFAPATDEKYGDISLSTNLSMAVQTPTGERSIDYLSSGAKDTAYLCLRCALVQLLYGRKMPFMVLDDAFSRIDDKRLVLMLKQINSFADEAQVFIFTCHERESIILSNIAQNVKKLELE